MLDLQPTLNLAWMLSILAIFSWVVRLRGYLLYFASIDPVRPAAIRLIFSTQSLSPIAITD